MTKHIPAAPPSQSAPLTHAPFVPPPAYWRSKALGSLASAETHARTLLEALEAAAAASWEADTVLQDAAGWVAEIIATEIPAARRAVEEKEG